jgi:hypothetical protein
MTGSTPGIIIMIVVVMIVLAAWIILVFYADAHPEWRRRGPSGHGYGQADGAVLPRHRGVRGRGRGVVRHRYLQPGLAVILADVAAKLLLADVYKAPAWASPAFIAVVLAAVAMLSIRDNRRATRQPAPGNQDRTDVPQPVQSAAGNAEPFPSQPERQALGHGGGVLILCDVSEPGRNCGEASAK